MELNNFIEKCREQFVDADEIDLNENTLFREIGSYDSLTGMSILFMIKDEFNIDLSEEIYKSKKTFKEIYDLIETMK